MAVHLRSDGDCRNAHKGKERQFPAYVKHENQNSDGLYKAPQENIHVESDLVTNESRVAAESRGNVAGFRRVKEPDFLPEQAFHQKAPQPGVDPPTHYGKNATPQPTKNSTGDCSDCQLRHILDKPRNLPDIAFIIAVAVFVNRI